MITKKYTITLPKDISNKLDQILQDEEMTFQEWVENAVEDYDS